MVALLIPMFLGIINDSRTGGGVFLVEANEIKIIRYLHAGKSPKEIAVILYMTCWAVWKIIERNSVVHQAYVAAYHKRYPHRETIPLKVLKEFVQ